MSKRKPRRPRKARSASRTRAKASGGRIAAHHQTRAHSKQARVLGLLSQPSGHHRGDHPPFRDDSDNPHRQPALRLGVRRQHLPAIGPKPAHGEHWPHGAHGSSSTLGYAKE
jgi:hypothetical protein